MRAKVTSSPWSSKRAASAGSSMVSGSHVPVPSSANFAAYMVPWSSGLMPRARIDFQLLSETNL